MNSFRCAPPRAYPVRSHPVEDAMTRNSKRNSVLLSLLLTTAAVRADPGLDRDLLGDYAYLESLYVDLHRSAELHDQEEKTGARMAAEMREAGFTVHTGIGGHGVVGVLENGEGPVLALRTVMDALPIEEKTGLPYASSETTIGADGTEVPVSHVCGHDAMMVSSIGAIRRIASMKERWRGTLILIAQPADESLIGARTMLRDGLKKLIPRPGLRRGLSPAADLPEQPGRLGFPVPSQPGQKQRPS